MSGKFKKNLKESISVNSGENPSGKRVSYLKNRDLPTILPGYQGNPFVNGRFVNEIKKNHISSAGVLKWLILPNPRKKAKKNDSFRLNVVKNSGFFHHKRDVIVWLGHASFFIRLDGVTFLIDPVFYRPPFVKRLADPPCGVSDVKNIDYLLISHTHRDHLDRFSIKKCDLNSTTALLPLGMGKLIRSWNRDITIQEGGWYQKFNTKEGEPSVYLLPSQHWSKRSIGDTNRILWGSYMIEGRKTKIFFNGDTSSSPQFRRTGEMFGHVDICLLPVGAYMPRKIMRSNHISPEEAVEAFRDLSGRRLIPMHYATFDLSDDPPGEPVRKLNAMKNRGEIKGELIFLDPGEELFL